jgi:hypothetical protein
MKKSTLLSVLIGTACLFGLEVAPSYAQVTIPVIGGTLSLKVENITSPQPKEMSASTFLTTLGTVSVNQFNGTAENTTPPFGPPYGVLPVNANVITGFFDFYEDENFRFIGTTNGSAAFSQSFNFTNAPTTINATFINSALVPSGTSIVNIPISSGSITLTIPTPPAPIIPVPVPVIPTPVTCTDCLIVRPDLLISYSTLVYSDLQEPEYRQEYKDDFSISSFRGGRILNLEDK